MLGFQVELGCGHNEPGCTGWANNQTVERVSFLELWRKSTCSSLFRKTTICASRLPRMGIQRWFSQSCTGTTRGGVLSSVQMSRVRGGEMGW